MRATAFVVAVVLYEISGVVRQLLSVSSESIARKPGISNDSCTVEGGGNVGGDGRSLQVPLKASCDC